MSSHDGLVFSYSTGELGLQGRYLGRGVIVKLRERLLGNGEAQHLTRKEERGDHPNESTETHLDDLKVFGVVVIFSDARLGEGERVVARAMALTSRLNSRKTCCGVGELERWRSYLFEFRREIYLFTLLWRQSELASTT